MIWAGIVAILIIAALGAPLFAVLLAASMLFKRYVMIKK